MKFRKHISGMKDKNGKAYASGYDARIPADILKAAGLLEEDGTLHEYALLVDEHNGRVILQKAVTLKEIERSEGKRTK